VPLYPIVALSNSLIIPCISRAWGQFPMRSQPLAVDFEMHAVRLDPGQTKSPI
jgi:hypothetical protein